MKLQSHDNYLEIDGMMSIQKGSVLKLIRSKLNDRVTVINEMGDRFSIELKDAELDGVPATSLNELYDYLKTNLFIDGGGGGEGLQRATLQDVMDGLDADEYVNPAVTNEYVSWFSQDLIKIDDDPYSDPPTSDDMNIKYPDARVRTTVYLEDVAGGSLKYTKLDETTWESTPYTKA